MPRIWATSLVLLVTAAGCGSSGSKAPPRAMSESRGACPASMEKPFDPSPLPRIEIRLEQDDLRQIYEAGRRLGVARAADGSTTQVLWAAFSPFVQNEVTWSPGTLGAFASNTPTDAFGQRLTLITLLRNSAGTAVRYDRGQFSRTGTAPAGAVDITAGRGDFEPDSYGLTASVTVNGREDGDVPFTAAKVAPAGSVRLTPTDRAYVFLAGAGADSGSPLRAVPADAAAIDLSKGNHVIVTRCAGRFVISQQS